jgi:hypothetical protein
MSESRADGVRAAHPLFQEGGSGSIPTSALCLRFSWLDLETAKALNRLWHSRMPRFGRVACRVAYGAEFEGKLYAVAIWTNPLSHSLPQMEWMELNRMAISPDAPRNTASRMLAWMARDIRKRLPDVVRLISYQDTAVHTGSIYRAAGWTATTLSAGVTWNRPSRSRKPTQSAAPKQRWEKLLREGETPCAT